MTNSRNYTLGLGLFSVPRGLNDDLTGTLDMLASIGFRELEVFGPYSFSDEKTKQQWAATSQMLGFSSSGFYGHTPEDFSTMVKDRGMRIPSMHTDIETLQHNMPALGQAARKIGATYVVLPALPEAYRTNIDTYKRSADLFNEIGKNAREEGIRFGYHNHGYGLKPWGEVRPIEIILDQTDPELVFFEMDLFWTTAGGIDPIELLDKYPNRYKLLHIKDMKPIKEFVGDGSTPQEWYSLFPNMTSCGAGDIDLEGIIKTSKKNGLEHYFVEHDMVQQPEVALKESFNYLKTISKQL
jgi:sugar phosphate isomerase/epimerase